MLSQSVSIFLFLFKKDTEFLSHHYLKSTDFDSGIFVTLGYGIYFTFEGNDECIPFRTFHETIIIELINRRSGHDEKIIYGSSIVYFVYKYQ